MDVHRHQGRALYVSPSPETHAYQHLYGTVRGNPMGKLRPALNLDAYPAAPAGKPKKQFNFLPWKKNKRKTAADDLVVNGNLSRHNKYKFGSVSALSSGGLYRDFDSTLYKTPSYSASDLKHASIKSSGSKSRGTVTYPWETYSSSNNNNNISSVVDVKNYKNAHLSNNPAGDVVAPIRSTVLDDRLGFQSTPCKCQLKKKSGPFGTLNLSSLKSSKCNCGFSSVRSSRGFAPPPPPRRKSILPEKVDLYAVHEEQTHPDSSKQHNIYDTLSRHNKHRAPAPPVIHYGSTATNQNLKLEPPVIDYSTAKSAAAANRLAKSLEKCRKDPFSSVASRKSILECDVTAYDLVKNYLKSNSRVDSDLDDDLSDNAIEEEKKVSGDPSKVDKPGGRHATDNSPSPVSSESESGIYSQASSIRIGGHGMKIFHPIDNNGSQTSSLYSEGSKTNSVDSRTSSWSNSSLSDDGIYSLPEPDYHDEEEEVNNVDNDSVLTFNHRTYNTGSTLNLRKPSGIRPNEDESRATRFYSGTPDPPRFSTIRKATSMVSLASGMCQNGTLRNRVKIPEPPTVGTPVPAPAPSIPPPPPPPPPPPNYTVPKVDKQEVSDVQEPKKAPEERRRSTGNDMSCSIASELAEKLRSNQPLLKKNEVKPKQQMKVNSHNPYAEVKSILKKTGENLTLSSNADKSSPNTNQVVSLQDVNDIKKKKRVQFKSLSNESLAVEHILHQTLSSSDEEWEEARESFEEPANSVAKGAADHKDQVKEEAKVADKGPVKKEAPSPKVQVRPVPTIAKSLSKTDQAVRSEYKVPTKASIISRPSHPPPPPPQNRGRAPAPRPLSSASKSYSHCDLRVNRPGLQRTPGLAKITVKEPPRFGALSAAPLTQAKFRLRTPVAGNAAANDATKATTSRLNATTSTTIFPKNGVPSPAASPEDTTSPRGKSHTDLGDQSQPDDQSQMKGSTPENSTHPAPAAENLSFLSIDTAIKDRLCSDLPLDGSTSDPANNEIRCSRIIRGILSADGSTCDYIHQNTDDEVFSENNTDIEVENCDKFKDNSSITCTVVSAAPKISTQLNTIVPIFNTTCDAGTTDPYSSHSKKFKDNEPTNSDDEELNTAVIEGPLYSNLLYVQRKSPSPPPLPTSLPPLPPKRDPGTILTTVPTYITRWSLQAPDASIEEPLYDTIPTPKRCDEQSIYESRRYNDTGATIVTISSGGTEADTSEHIYSSLGSESIYEELPDRTDNDTMVLDVPNPFGSHRRSFFEGASKAEILKFLEKAKERVVGHLNEDDILDDDDDEIPQSKTIRNIPTRISNISSSSDTSTISSNSSNASRECFSSDDLASIKSGRQNSTTDVERSDSGVGTETSKPIVLRRIRQEVEEVCADCEQQLETTEGGNSCCPLVCKKCDKKRCERKEIVTEIVETEFKYGKDLVVIKEEFKNPMEVAGLLSKDQLSGVFLNLSELIVVNKEFSEKLKDAVDIAAEQGDEEYTTVNIGKLFLETSSMLRAFEVYCIRQGAASVLLTNLEKEKELLRIFLRVSQMENSLLRRMNLSAFLMVPVQRVTKYPLLLNRLYKVTPYHHKDRESLREAQLKIELHLEHINQQTKGITGTKIWRRISNISTAHRRIVNVSDIGSIHLRKMALEVLEWSKEDIRFVMAGKLAFSGTIDFTKSRRGRAVKFTPSHAILATLGKPNSNYRPDLAQEDSVLFPKNTGIEDTTLLLMKEKNGRYSLARDPLHLGSCVISAELEDEDIIEIQEYTTKESVFLKCECRSDTSEWLKQLRYHAKDLGTWKRRRNALANIMINGMNRQQ